MAKLGILQCKMLHGSNERQNRNHIIIRLPKTHYSYMFDAQCFGYENTNCPAIHSERRYKCHLVGNGAIPSSETIAMNTVQTHVYVYRLHTTYVASVVVNSERTSKYTMP